MTTVQFEICDPAMPPASELLAAMTVELAELYASPSRLDHPKLAPAELTAPGGTYLVGWEDGTAVAGGGLRRLEADVAEIKRMYVRPKARSRGLAGALLAALTEAARAMGYRAIRLDTGPKQVTALALYKKSGFVEVEPYNDNPFACFWGEKVLDGS